MGPTLLGSQVPERSPARLMVTRSYEIKQGTITFQMAMTSPRREPPTYSVPPNAGPVLPSQYPVSIPGPVVRSRKPSPADGLQRPSANGADPGQGVPQRPPSTPNRAARRFRPLVHLALTQRTGSPAVRRIERRSLARWPMLQPDVGDPRRDRLGPGHRRAGSTVAEGVCIGCNERVKGSSAPPGSSPHYQRILHYYVQSRVSCTS